MPFLQAFSFPLQKNAIFAGFFISPAKKEQFLQVKIL